VPDTARTSPVLLSGRPPYAAAVAIPSDGAEPSADVEAAIRHPLLLGLAVVLVAANLRPALASVGPVLDDVRADLMLSGITAALLVSLPVLCLGLLAPLAPRLARQWGMEPILTVVLMAIAAGLFMRVLAGTGSLFAGTVIASGAIAVGNVLLPALIKRDFPTHSGTMIGVYTMALSGSAAVAAAATVPLGQAIGLGWRGALGVWVVPVVLALVLWFPFTGGHTPPPPVQTPRGSLLTDPLAWQVTVFFGVQSLFFYAILSWLPSIYRDHGYSPAAAGFVLSAMTFVQIPITLILPRFAARARDQRVYLAATTTLTAVGLVGVLLAPTTLPYLWSGVMGMGIGGSFSLGLLLFVVRSRTPTDTARLSAMAQTFGYVIAATGPMLLGAVYDATASWTVPLTVLLLLAIPQFIAALLAGRPLHVGNAQ
jgi:MFS transporter, CP family, cyanate transporter